MPATVNSDLGDEAAGRQAMRLAITAAVSAVVALAATAVAFASIAGRRTSYQANWPTTSGWWWAALTATVAAIGLAITAWVIVRRATGRGTRTVVSLSALSLAIAMIFVAATVVLIVTANSNVIKAVPGRPRRRRICGDRRLPDPHVARSAIGAPSTPPPGGDPTNDDERRFLASMWSRAAGHENEAVSSFLQLESELAALGAPDELIGGAALAAQQEVGHAMLCARAAAEHNGEVTTLQPVGYRTPRSTPRSRIGRHHRLVRLAIESYSDGCCNEGGEAIRIDRASKNAAGALGAELATVALEERQHAELAWSTVEWVIAEGGPSVRWALRALPTGGVSSSPHPRPAGVRAEVLLNHGWVTPADATTAAAAARADARRRLDEIESPPWFSRRS